MTKSISAESIAALVERLCVEANTYLPPDVGILLECAAESEPDDSARAALEDCVANFKYAASVGLPICQDTGMAVVFADVGQDAHISGGLFEDAVNLGVRNAYVNNRMRCSIVGDPLRRVNTNDNTPAVIHTRLVAGDALRITVAPKGFGSENMSASIMFLPSDTRETIEDRITEVVRNAGSQPCPPVILGVGLGGTLDACARAAKLALLRPIDTRNGDPFYAEMELRTLHKINALRIGAQGFGGRHTALAVNIEALPTHIAGLPCVVNVSCHVTRHASGEL
ncbi:MAG: fumarate hydratase [Oscillospiraceae bacterium]|jgi:fumarate hydratase subunit alpha|nr:fumarate hydratase [Oscillospiraceae bacterium]